MGQIPNDIKNIVRYVRWLNLQNRINIEYRDEYEYDNRDFVKNKSKYVLNSRSNYKFEKKWYDGRYLKDRTTYLQSSIGNFKTWKIVARLPNNY